MCAIYNDLYFSKLNVTDLIPVNIMAYFVRNGLSKTNQ
jgi:hypothetical protein